MYNKPSVGIVMLTERDIALKENYEEFLHYYFEYKKIISNTVLNQYLDNNSYYYQEYKREIKRVEEQEAEDFHTRIKSELRQSILSTNKSVTVDKDFYLRILKMADNYLSGKYY